MLLISEKKAPILPYKDGETLRKLINLLKLSFDLFFFMKSKDIGCEGNLFLNKLVGSQIIVVPQLQYKSGLKQMMEKISEKL